MYNEIAIELRRNKITQDVAARTLGVSRVTMNRYLNGRGELKSKNFNKLINLIGWRVERAQTSRN